ncbi:MAG: RimK/LysX family protein [bacterium]|nr:RimK/LysX family protein [bacterium]
MIIKEKSIIGWREWISFPGLGIPAIKSKIDTGARTSAIHAFFIEPKEVDGKEYVKFGVHPIRKKTDVEIICEALVLDKRMVTDSGGHTELRYVIKTNVKIDDHEWPIEVTLAKRENMRFRCLLGRTAILGRFIIDPQKSFLFGRTLRRQYNLKS